MSKTRTTAFSGCLIWLILVSVIGSCIVPVFFIIGGITSFSDFAIKTTGHWLCPDGTTPESYSYITTTRDKRGFEGPTTMFELHCVNSSGNIVKKDPGLYTFIWMGISSAIGLIVTTVLSLALSVPGGMLVTKMFERFKISKVSAGSPR